MIFTAEETIDAAPNLVWRHLTDPALMTAWMPGIDDMRPADGGPLGEGARLTFRSRGADRTSDVVTCRACERLVLRSTQGPVTATYTYAVAPVGSGTRVTLEADCVAAGLAKLMTPLLRPLIRRSDGNQLKLLKAAVTGIPVAGRRG